MKITQLWITVNFTEKPDLSQFKAETKKQRKIKKITEAPGQERSDGAPRFEAQKEALA